MSLTESTDVVLQRNEDGIFDFVLDEDGDIKTDNFLDTSLLRSIYAERRADESEMPVSNLRRGWIGNLNKDFEDGSKVWLYEQAAKTLETMNGVRSEIENSLQWLIEDGVALDYEVKITTESYDDDIQLVCQVKIKVSPSKVDNMFFPLFENSGKYNYAT